MPGAHLRAPVSQSRRDSQPRALSAAAGLDPFSALVESDHGVVVGDAEELTKPLALSLRVVDELFVERLVVEIWAERRAVLTRPPYLSLPPEGRGRDGVLLPGRVAPGGALGFVPVQNGQADVPAVADDVDELRVGPEGVECRDAAHVTRGLVPHQRFVLNFSVEAEDPVEEGWVWDRLPGAEQAFELFPGDLELGEPLVPGQFGDQLRGSQTVPALELAGDPVHLGGDCYLGVCVHDPVQQRGAGPRAPYDEEVRITAVIVRRSFRAPSRRFRSSFHRA